MSANSWSWAGWKADEVQKDRSLRRLSNEIGRHPVYTPSRLVSAATTATAADGVVLADATGGAFTVSLPTDDAYLGRRFTVVRMNGGGNAVTVATVLGGNITLGAQYAYATVQYCLTTAPATFTWVRVS